MCLEHISTFQSEISINGPVIGFRVAVIYFFLNLNAFSVYFGLYFGIKLERMINNSLSVTS